jgi:uncharacterized protein (DUF433 family)
LIYVQVKRPLKADAAMNNHDRIFIDPDILVGKPVVKGTRLSVDFLLGLLAQGWAESEILRNYPGLEREDLLACWAYAAEALSQDNVYHLRSGRLARSEDHATTSN